MNIYFLFFSICLCMCTSFSMHKNGDASVIFEKIKKIDPYASEEEYQKLFYELKQHNLSIQQCVEFLLERKKNKALNRIKENGYLNDENIETLKEFYKKLQKAEAGKKVKLVIHISPDIVLSKEEKDDIISLFSDDYLVKTKIAEPICEDVRLSKNSDISNFEGTACIRKFKESCNNNHTIITPGSCHVYIGIDFEASSDETRKAMLLHEKQHLKQNHQVLEKCLDRMIEKNMQQMHFGNHLILPAIFKYQHFSRILEIEADRLAAISGGVTTASYFTQAIEINSQEEQDPAAKYGRHPRTRKRVEWFLRLYKLKKAETSVNKITSTPLKNIPDQPSKNISNLIARFDPRSMAHDILTSKLQQQ